MKAVRADKTQERKPRSTPPIQTVTTFIEPYNGGDLFFRVMNRFFRLLIPKFEAILLVVVICSFEVEGNVHRSVQKVLMRRCDTRFMETAPEFTATWGAKK